MDETKRVRSIAREQWKERVKSGEEAAAVWADFRLYHGETPGAYASRTGRWLARRARAQKGA